MSPAPCPARAVCAVSPMLRLAGTLDYAGRMEEGERVAQHAVESAEHLFGSTHPVLAKCLTAHGFFIKAKGEAARSECARA